MQMLVTANVTSLLALVTANVTSLLAVVTTNVVPNALILSTLMIEVIRSSETSVLTRVTRRHIPEDGIILRYFSLKFEVLLISRLTPRTTLAPYTTHNHYFAFL
jgi:hypothetical protein